MLCGFSAGKYLRNFANIFKFQVFYEMMEGIEMSLFSGTPDPEFFHARGKGRGIHTQKTCGAFVSGYPPSGGFKGGNQIVAFKLMNVLYGEQPGWHFHEWRFFFGDGFIAGHWKHAF